MTENNKLHACGEKQIQYTFNCIAYYLPKFIMPNCKIVEENSLHVKQTCTINFIMSKLLYLHNILIRHRQ